MKVVSKARLKEEHMAEQDIALMAHLLRRAGFGASREEIEAKAVKGLSLIHI